MCVHVNSLPDELLLLTFDGIPLIDLLELDRVCPRWKWLLPSACARRRRLVLIVGRRRMEQIRFCIPYCDTFQLSSDNPRPFVDIPVVEQKASLSVSCLMPDTARGAALIEEDFSTEMARLVHAHLSGHLVTYLADLFPNVNTLVVIHPDCYEADLLSVVDLLRSWPLTTLKLWLRTVAIDERYVHRAEHHPVGLLLCNINKHSSLQQLTLNIGNDRPQKFTFPVEFFSFIGQLKVVKLSTGNYDGGIPICDIVHRFDSAHLRQIALGGRLEDVLNPERIEFTTKLSQLYGIWRFEPVEQLIGFGGRFGSLTTLQIKCSPNINFSVLLSNLAKLTHLARLKLSSLFPVHDENPFALAGGGEGDDDQSRAISLPQVKYLELAIFTAAFTRHGPHRYFESIGPQIFPSVEAIFFYSDGACSTCEASHVEPERTLKKCHRLLKRPLKDNFANSSVRIFGLRVRLSRIIRIVDGQPEGGDGQAEVVGAFSDGGDPIG